MVTSRRQRVPVQVNQFVGGINTEANPLSFPPTASVDEVNMEINRDGSRRRRNGFDAEVGYEARDTGVSTQDDLRMASSQFHWTNTSSSADQEFLIVQLGNYIAVHDLNKTPVSSTPVFTKTFAVSTYSTVFNYAQVDGLVVIATGEKEIYTLSFDGEEITSTQSNLLIRDLFGVEAVVDGVDLSSPLNLQVRPTSITGRHIYNLRNQTFALPRVWNQNTVDKVDPIERFKEWSVMEGAATNIYPSNADSTIKYIYANSGLDSDREVERFVGRAMYLTQPANTKAPTGYFIIDALSRGESRAQAEAELRAANPDLTLIATDLQLDRTPGGAKVVTQYSGRVWYAGFSPDVEGAHSKSPRMSSYILFSQVVQDPSNINLCYQAADPTSIDDPDIADTDGGFIKLDEAYNIKALVAVDSSLFVFAENGVWRIVGVDESTFTASGYSVSKITEVGCLSSQSVVVSGRTLSYWAESGIYGISQDQVGSWTATNLTQETLQTLYDNISKRYKESVVGYYDDFNATVRWVWGYGEDTANELTLNLKQSGFTRNEIVLPSGVNGVIGLVGGTTTEGAVTYPVTISDGTTVTSSTGEVFTPASKIQRGITDAYYLTILSETPTITYTFCRYNRGDISYDWSRLGTPTDSPAYLVAGSLTGGDGRLRKNVPYLSVYFRQDGGDAPASSCILTTQWDWSDNYLSGKWSSPREIYRPQRATNSQGILPTRNKIRGSGRSVAFKFQSTEGFGMHIYGWEFNIEANGTE